MRFFINLALQRVFDLNPPLHPSKKKGEVFLA
jgi:hypothetical protein